MKKTLRILTVAALVSLAGGLAMADSITKPTTFTSGTTIKSSEMNANFDTVYGQVNKIGAVINVDQTNSRVGIGVANPQSIMQVATNGNSFTVANQTGLGGTVSKRILVAGSEPGIHLSSDSSGGTQTGSETSLIGMQIGATQLNNNITGLFNQIFYGGQPLAIVQATPNQPGFPTPRVLISTDGNVGIGTTDPQAPLHIYTYDSQTSWKPSVLKVDLLNIGYGNELDGVDNGQVNINYRSSGNVVLANGGGKVGIGTYSLNYPLQMASGAYVTTGGTWTNASSRTLKDNITNLSLESAQSTLEKLNPVTFTYKKEKDDQHVGFIAEDVPDLVATKDRKGLSPMDIVAVVTKVVQEQQKTMKAQDETIQKQGKEIQALTAMLQRTLAGMSSIQQKVSQLEAAQPVPFLQKASYTETVH